MEWIKIDLNNKNTFPPLGKKVYWFRTGLGRTEPYRIYASLKETKFGFSVDGTSLDNGDYWIEIKEPV